MLSLMLTVDPPSVVGSGVEAADAAESARPEPKIDMMASGAAT